MQDEIQASFVFGGSVFGGRGGGGGAGKGDIRSGKPFTLFLVDSDDATETSDEKMWEMKRGTDNFRRIWISSATLDIQLELITNPPKINHRMLFILRFDN